MPVKNGALWSLEETPFKYKQRSGGIAMFVRGAALYKQLVKKCTDCD
jgi:hypothetical protein